MSQNNNISLSLGNKIDLLNKSQSLDARYGVYDTIQEALDVMSNYGLNGRLVAVYTDKPNGKVKLYTYNETLNQLDELTSHQITGRDMNINTVTGTRIPVWISTSQTWRENGYIVGDTVTGSTIALRDTQGRLKANPAIESDDLVPLGQLEGMFEDYIQEPTTDGTSGQVLTTDGSGGVSWQDGGVLDTIQEVISVTLSDIGATSLDDEDILDKLLAYRTSNSLGLEDDKLYYYEILGDNISDIPENNIINKPIKEIIGDEYTILSSDKNYTLHFLSDVDVIITVPNLMGMNKIEGKQLGDGQLIFNGDTGVDIFTANMLLNKTDSKYSVFGLEKIENNQWVLYGNLELL